jgi:hypothetical protein
MSNASILDHRRLDLLALIANAAALPLSQAASMQPLIGFATPL